MNDVAKSRRQATGVDLSFLSASGDCLTAVCHSTPRSSCRAYPTTVLVRRHRIACDSALAVQRTHDKKATMHLYPVGSY